MAVILFNGEITQEFYNFSFTNDYMTFVVVGTAFHNLAVGLLMNVSRSMITKHCWKL